MKENISPKFTKEMSENISKISNGKYKNVKLNNEGDIIIETQNGNYISINNLSIGTIEQLYLSLRLSFAEEISKENLIQVKNNDWKNICTKYKEFFEKNLK